MSRLRLRAAPGGARRHRLWWHKFDPLVMSDKSPRAMRARMCAAAIYYLVRPWQAGAVRTAQICSNLVLLSRFRSEFMATFMAN